MNPYSLDHVWPPDTHAAYLDMPKWNGFVISLFYAPPNALKNGYETAWREWCKRWPKNMWPSWIQQWADYKRTHGTNNQMG